MGIPFSTRVRMMRSPSRTIIGMKSNATQARRRLSCSKYHRKLFAEQNPYGHTKCTANKGATQSIEAKEMGGECQEDGSSHLIDAFEPDSISDPGT